MLKKLMRPDNKPRTVGQRVVCAEPRDLLKIIGYYLALIIFWG